MAGWLISERKKIFEEKEEKPSTRDDKKPCRKENEKPVTRNPSNVKFGRQVEPRNSLELLKPVTGKENLKIFNLTSEKPPDDKKNPHIPTIFKVKTKPCSKILVLTDKKSDMTVQELPSISDSDKNLCDPPVKCGEVPDGCGGHGGGGLDGSGHVKLQTSGVTRAALLFGPKTSHRPSPSRFASKISKPNNYLCTVSAENGPIGEQEQDQRS